MRAQHVYQMEKHGIAESRCGQRDPERQPVGLESGRYGDSG